MAKPIAPKIHFPSLREAFNTHFVTAVRGTLKSSREHSFTVSHSKASSHDLHCFGRGELRKGGFESTGLEGAQEILHDGDDVWDDLSVFEFHTHPNESVAAPSKTDLPVLKGFVDQSELADYPVSVIAAVSPAHGKIGLIFFKPTKIFDPGYRSDLDFILERSMAKGQQAVAEALEKSGCFKALALEKARSRPALNQREIRRIADYFEMHKLHERSLKTR